MHQYHDIITYDKDDIHINYGGQSVSNGDGGSPMLRRIQGVLEEEKNGVDWYQMGKNIWLWRQAGYPISGRQDTVFDIWPDNGYSAVDIHSDIEIEIGLYIGWS